ncbi:hypothetical protein P280DRAFT_463320 [Massarina eburnea CBS 473.64]|uniref:ELYS-like domain-containing protein n=1 Tax=Massarina eburnea CBS 473.64 TaxID=1395130 RepID=A0A6A6RHP7_9PLEO|nr:hypothetical protein P280DRAFT_463320 [Massarina eburnea CBS 473.64]
MLDVDNYDDIFQGWSYSEGLVSDIQENQSLIGGKLFFERLLDLLKIKWNKLYPPRSTTDLRALHKTLTTAPITLHYKHCLLFYLLKDLAPSIHVTPSIDAAFANDIHLEKSFRTFIDGIWHLDHLQFETAVTGLSHPCIVQTFPDEILSCLLKRGGYGAPKEGEADTLPLAYFSCAAPPLAKENVRKDFAKYLARRNVSEMYYWLRSRPEHEHQSLLEILIDTALYRGTTGNSEVYPTSERAMELVGLPFEEREERWLETYLTEGKGRLLTGAEDTVVLRRMATGRLVEAGREGGVRGKRVDGLNWEGIRVGVKNGLGPRMEEKGFVV